MHPSAITFAILSVLHLAHGPVQMDARNAAEARGFLRYGKLGNGLATRIGDLRGQAWLDRRTVSDDEIRATVERMVEVTLEWQRFDAHELGARVAAAL